MGGWFVLLAWRGLILACVNGCVFACVQLWKPCPCVRILINLQKWAEFLREVDPDIITGYNIQNFDLPYLLNRAAHLKVGDFSYLGRIKDIRSSIKEAMLQSRQMGKRENKVINIEGRVQFDLLQVIFIHLPYTGDIL